MSGPKLNEMHEEKPVHIGTGDHITSYDLEKSMACLTADQWPLTRITEPIRSWNMPWTWSSFQMPNTLIWFRLSNQRQRKEFDGGKNETRGLLIGIQYTCTTSYKSKIIDSNRVRLAGYDLVRPEAKYVTKPLATREFAPLAGDSIWDKRRHS